MEIREGARVYVSESVYGVWGGSGTVVEYDRRTVTVRMDQDDQLRMFARDTIKEIDETSSKVS